MMIMIMMMSGGGGGGGGGVGASDSASASASAVGQRGAGRVETGSPDALPIALLKLGPFVTIRRHRREMDHERRL